VSDDVTRQVGPTWPTLAMPLRRRVARRAGAGVLIIAALAAGRAVTTAYDDDTGLDDPFVVAGSLGEPVSLRYADVTATGVDGSTLVSPDLGLRTTGVWLVIPLKIVTKGEPADVRYAAVEDTRGRVYVANGDRSQYQPGVAQPGVPRYASVLVELPVDAVAGAHLRVALDSLDQRRDDMADIDLGLTEVEARTWAARTDKLQVPEPASTPPEPAPGSTT
jgi:hypothetical protein